MNIQNRTYYFYNDLINIRDFDAWLLKVDKKKFMDLIICYIGCVTKKKEWCVNSVNPLYLMINKIDGFGEEKDDNKYFIISDIDRNSEILEKYNEVFSGIKDCIEQINGTELGVYDKYFMKTKVDSSDNIPLNKLLSFPAITVIIRNSFEKDGKYYPNIFLDECLYEI